MRTRRRARFRRQTEGLWPCIALVILTPPAMLLAYAVGGIW